MLTTERPRKAVWRETVEREQRDVRLIMELRVQRARVRAERIKLRERRLRMLLRAVIATDPQLRERFAQCLRLTPADRMDLDVSTEAELMRCVGVADGST
jgi:hypothetical protein